MTRAVPRWPAAALVAVLALTACGKKATPVNPSMRVPAAVTDLRGQVRDSAVELTWTNPTRRVDNTRLRDIVAARVYRTDDDGTGDPRPALLTRGRVAGYAELLTLTEMPSQPGGSAPPLLTGRRVEVTDREGLISGRRYTYVVLIEDGEGRVSPPSLRISITLLSTPTAPRALTATEGRRQVRLAWQPPEKLADGQPIGSDVVYEVLRGPARDTPLQAITPTPIAATEFVDSALDAGRTYYYAVRALRRAAGTIARGGTSAVVAATPSDRGTPAPPQNLTATKSGSEVTLVWLPIADPGIAGYVIYRAAAGQDFERVGSTPAHTTIFVDRNVSPGTYRYAVTSRDASAGAIESARSAETTVSLP